MRSVEIIETHSRNKHDEFLSGRENIRIEIEMWRVSRPGAIYKISGDRNSLINQFDFQGGAFLLDGDVLAVATAWQLPGVYAKLCIYPV